MQCDKCNKSFYTEISIQKFLLFRIVKYTVNLIYLFDGAVERRRSFYLLKDRTLR